MCTVLIDMPAPGTFAPIASETPSSGCTWTTSTFGRSPSPAIDSNGGSFYDRTLPEEQYPLAPGAPCHENVGIVQESRDPSLKPGQRVIALQSGGLL